MSTDPQCELAVQLVTDTYPTAVRWLQTVLCLLLFPMFLLLAKCYLRKPVPVHPNLRILFASTVISYFLYDIGYMIIQLRYNYLLFWNVEQTQPCVLLSPIWFCLLSRIPQYAHVNAIPWLHFAIMVERVRATILAKRYEREGIRFGLYCVFAVSIYTICLMCFVSFTALADFDGINGPPVAVNSLIASGNSAIMLYMHYFNVALILLTVLGDLLLLSKNKRMRKNNFHTLDYSLSRKYQTRENITALRIIFPLDLSYSLLFLVYTVFSILLRTFKEQISKPIFMAHYDLISCLSMLHALITLWVYKEFIKQRLKKSKKVSSSTVGYEPAVEMTEKYFQFLTKQWRGNRDV